MNDRRIPAGSQQFIALAVKLALENVDRGQRPFGAVVVHDGEVIGEGVNTVLRDGDPTAHAETEAVRQACQRIGSRDLSGAYVASSCRPCDLCQAVARLARIDLVLYAGLSRRGPDLPDLAVLSLPDPSAQRPFDRFALLELPMQD
ncbi:nucleoside deaminase [Kribbella sp. NPDC050241]|uniref:nucleoside deaminase n=1 Tax=Kribbella sp. NPDC050241 TaxID=3364115 RepID=UPI0037A9CD31